MNTTGPESTPRSQPTAALHHLPTSRSVPANAPANPAEPEKSQRNPGLHFDPRFLDELRAVNLSAIERRAATLVKRRSIKGDNQSAWLLRALALMDLTTLNSNDTDERVRRLCAKALHPLSTELRDGLGLGDRLIRPAAVCVYHPFVATAAQALHGSGIEIAAVSTAFPHGLAPLETRVREIELSVADGATEIDVVIKRGLVFAGRWQELYDEVQAFRQACGSAHLKVILGTGDLVSLRNVTLASAVAMMAGADFIKTSTGKESVNATLPVGLAMVRAIRTYHGATGIRIGFKPAGGISTTKTALDWLVLIKEELGRRWLEPDLFRFGASSLLTDIERQLDHHVTGSYSATHRHALA
ncbi:deoxyribose-phosphate aldolase [Tianweitania sp. BSSL-BM11]|uniref:Deoxyribose-phosphate aldolase n=1 Tax=Tianweitania aestuarii TaxID=2814886 RepID=A0ABS5RXP9_9HYPH|nr:deoxyribose-phosphate aldolase [Tianweitania aestuarii]MBS9721762.1 deoxyribose-phosphate aldolase [Tianweitania aestuarii]